MSKPEKKPAIKMRVNVAGYGGEPVSVFGAFDPATDVLLILRSGEYETAPRDGFLRITTQSRDETHDAVFEADNLREAIVAFYELDSMRLLNLSDTMRRHDPRNRIQRMGVDEHGQKYQIDPSVTNGQIAILIASFYAKQQRAQASAEDFMDDLYALQSI